MVDNLDNNNEQKPKLQAIVNAMEQYDKMEEAGNNSDPALETLRAALADFLGQYSKQSMDKLLAISTLKDIVEQEDECPWEDFLANLWEPINEAG
jgi:ABC-type enterochelin transport system substrate-binding protein